MDFDISMRYAMVQAQRKAGGAPVAVEHVFVAMLELFDKEVPDIARRPEHEDEVGAGLDSVHEFVADAKVDVWPTLYILNEALGGKLEADLPAPDNDVPGWMAHKPAAPGEKYAPAHFLGAVSEARTPLLDLCWVAYDKRMTSQKNAAAKGREIIAERLGLELEPVETETPDAGNNTLPGTATVAMQSNVFGGSETMPIQSGNETVPIQPPTPEPPKPKPAPEPPTPKPEPPKPAPEVVEIFIPKPGDANKPGVPPPFTPPPPPDEEEEKKQRDLAQQKELMRQIEELARQREMERQREQARQRELERQRALERQRELERQKARQKTRIAGLTFKGGPFKAAVKYYLLVLVIPVVLCIIFRERLGRLVPDDSWTTAGVSIVVLFWAALILRGVFALLGRRCKALEFFANSMVNIIWVSLAILALTRAGGYEHTPLFVKIIIFLYAFILMGLCLNMLRRLSELLIKDDRRKALFVRSGVGKVSGTPSTMFFEFLLRACMFVFLVFSIVWMGNLQVNNFWQAAFAIYGFLLAYETIRIMLMCWSLARAITPPHRFFMLSQFLLTSYSFLSLPAVGLFLMWYFNWLPMRTWVIVLYCIYGALWLLVIFSFLLTANKEAAKR